MVTVLPSCSKATAHPPTFLAQDFSLPLRAGSILSRNHQGYMRDWGANCPRDQGRGWPWGAQDHFSQEVSTFRLEEPSIHSGAPPPTARHGPAVSPEGKNGQLWPLEGRRCPGCCWMESAATTTTHHHPPGEGRERSGCGVVGKEGQEGWGNRRNQRPWEGREAPPPKAKVTSSEQTGW